MKAGGEIDSDISIETDSDFLWEELEENLRRKAREKKKKLYQFKMMGMSKKKRARNE